MARKRPDQIAHGPNEQMITSPSDQALCDFIAELALDDVPRSARERLTVLLADMAAVSVAGRRVPACEIAADYAQAVHPAPEATALFDGRLLGAPGAAFANGVLANALDYDDGHRLTKGHPGAIVIPAALAIAQLVDASEVDFLTAVVVGYEVAIRAGIALHGRDPAYHASGAWGALGAAAAAARLLGLDPTSTLASVGLAEYHGPIAPMMRSCAEPAMTKDACAWGAWVGVTSALLAARGFTSVRAEYPDAGLDDLGARWRLEELYVKAHPCCRWSQGAIAAALDAIDGRPIDAGLIRRVTVRTFAAADGLAKVVPETTEEAQYNLHWPLACALVRGRFDVADALGPFSDPEISAVFARVEVEIDPQLTAAFPGRRLSAVEIELADGRRLRAGPTEAPGEPDDPELPALVAAKVSRHIGTLAGDRRSSPARGLRDLNAEQLVALLCDCDLAMSVA
jgi:2-methylcitrate dehydratase PrpD